MTAPVLDASFTMQWLFDDEVTAEGYAALDLITTLGATVPALWFVEVTNTLAMAERRGRLSAVQFSAGIVLLESLQLHVDEPAGLAWSPPVLDLLRQHRLTAYDAIYLDLARRRGLPLATLDRALRTAASAIGVPLFNR